MSDNPRDLFEDAQIRWRRDFDALVVGFVFGMLVMYAWLK